MALQLFSIEQMPRAIPDWEDILQDLGAPRADQVAHALGVGRATVYRWNSAHSAPRVACLALFWLTRWGRSAIDAQATNDATMAVQYARALGEDRLKLLDQVRQLESANAGLAMQRALASPRRSFALADHGRARRMTEQRLAVAEAACLAWPALVLPLPELELDPVPPEGSASTVKTPGVPGLLELRQAPQSKARSTPARTRAATPVPDHGPEDNSLLSRRAADRSPCPTPAPAPSSPPDQASAALRGRSDDRPGTPASAPLAALCSHGGSRPHTPALVSGGAVASVAPSPPPGQPDRPARVGAWPAPCGPAGALASIEALPSIPPAPTAAPPGAGAFSGLCAALLSPQPPFKGRP